jgi:hypothetical protein
MKTTFDEILSTDLTLGSFPVSSKIFSLGREAEIIAKVVQDKIDEDGIHAQIHCSNIVSWMNELTRQAQACLDLQMEKDLKNSK